MGIEPMTFRLQSECSTTKLKEQTQPTTDLNREP